MKEDDRSKVCDPLCAFALSPRFSIQICDDYNVENSKRPMPQRFPLSKKFLDCFYRTKQRFKPNRRRTPSFVKYLTGFIKNRHRETLNLQEVLNIVTQVWNTPIESKSPTTNFSANMRKTGGTSSDVSSPVLLRRRLSAPETIMRKHMLAQQRSDSQDSDVTQTSDVRSCQWRGDITAGSDPNLNKRRDLGLMRKSTLLRRMWNNSKPLLERNSRLSGAYYDWQHSSGRLSSGRSTHSLGSNHSSPEHLRESFSRRSLNGDDFKVLPKHAGTVGISPKQRQYRGDITPSSKSKISTTKKSDDVGNFYSFCSNCSNITSLDSTMAPASSDNTRISTSTVTPKTTETENENFTTFTSRSTGTCTFFSDNSDSAFTNSRSNFTQSFNGSNTRNTPYSEDIQKHVNEEPEENNENINETSKIIKEIDNNNISNPKSMTSDDSQKYEYTNNVNESSTQTVGTTNLNVISNVQLSESTLDLIFNQVMQDIKNTLPGGLNINTLSTCSAPTKQTVLLTEQKEEHKLINVKEVPSFYLKRKEEITFNPEHNRIVKYMISNVGTGSPYSKPAEVPQVVVPRFSALPRSSSMEVNTSSAESTDKESDTVSLVDSLEDPSSPRIDPHQTNRHDNKPVRGDLSLLLPDNSNKKKNKLANNKPAAFFIPIENTIRQDVKAVSELMPEKVRQKLSKRQLRREMKILQSKNKLISPKSDSNYISASENGNHFNFIAENTSECNLNACSNEINNCKPKRRSKPVLPSIEAIRKIKIDHTKCSDKPKTNKKRPESSGKSKQTQWSSKSRQKPTERLSPIYTSKNEYVYDTGPRRIYHKTELSNSNKRIEILEIMECVDTTNAAHNGQKGKSKIPILVHPTKPPKASASEQNKNERPTYLDFDQIQLDDSKIDQLIANILIDTLNKSDEHGTMLKTANEKRPTMTQTPNHPKCAVNSKYAQKFSAIPEELSQQNSAEDIEQAAKILVKQSLDNNNVDQLLSDNKNVSDPYKGKAALAVIKDDNFSSIPKGWITFYMLHKNQGSPDSTSDEGSKNSVESKQQNDGDKNNNNDDDLINNVASNINDDRQNLLPAYYKMAGKDIPNETPAENVSSSSENDLKHALPTTNNGRHKHAQKKMGRIRSHYNNNNNNNGWSVTVSGTNSCGEHAPDLEMRLKFPQKTTKPIQNQSDSGLGEEHLHHAAKKTNLPFVNAKKSFRRFEVSSNEDGKSTYRDKLPDIVKNKPKRSKRCDSSVTFGSMNRTETEPRQTRTSSRRFSIHKPRLQVQHPENFTVDERQFAEVLRCLPHILTITGNAISPERKPRFPTMSERDLTRHICANQQ